MSNSQKEPDLAESARQYLARATISETSLGFVAGANDVHGQVVATLNLLEEVSKDRRPQVLGLLMLFPLSPFIRKELLETGFGVHIEENDWEKSQGEIPPKVREQLSLLDLVSLYQFREAVRQIEAENAESEGVRPGRLWKQKPNAGVLTKEPGVGQTGSMPGFVQKKTSEESSKLELLAVPGVVDGAKSPDKIESVLGALNGLTLFQVGRDQSLDLQIVELKRLSSLVTEGHREALTAALNRVLTAAEQAAVHDRSLVVLDVVKTAMVTCIPSTHIELTREDVQKAVQGYVDWLHQRTEEGSYQSNAAAVELIKSCLDTYEIELMYKGQAVQPRAHPQRNASIQIRSLGANRTELLTDTAWPKLTAVLKKGS